VIVTIHQPEHLPWPGFFDKIRRAQEVVLLDSVQFEKNYFQNRNRIRGKDGPVWITVPVLTKGRSTQTIAEVEIDNTQHWRKTAWRSLEMNYRKAPHFADYAPFFEEVYEQEWTKLADLNLCILKWMARQFGIERTFRRSSELGCEGSRTDLLLALCRKLGASAYLSGAHGKEYLELAKFEAAGIRVEFQEFRPREYKQLYDPFVPGLSAVDLLFNHGPAGAGLLAAEGP
jgi:hypothetical protein